MAVDDPSPDDPSPDDMSPSDVAYGIDLIALVKAIAVTFVVLVLGSLAGGKLLGLLPFAAERLVVAYQVWLVAVAVGAFAWAGSRIGEATRPAVHGAVAAFGSYVLVVPLAVLAGSRATVVTILLVGVLAAVVGGLAGLAAGRLRGSVLP